MPKYSRSIVHVSIYFLFLVVLSASAQEAKAADAVLYVATTGTDSASCGSSTNPCRTIQKAIDLPPIGQITLIKVAQGTYTGSGSEVVSLDLIQPGRSIQIVGGYATSNWETPLPNANLTTIDGQGERRVIDIRSRTGTAGMAQLVSLKNLTIQNGFVNQKLATIRLDWTAGGGILCRNDNATGVLELATDNVVVKNNRIQGQASSGLAMGGGIALLYGCPGTFRDTVISENEILGGPAPDNTRGQTVIGGGIMAGENSNVAGHNVEFLNNSIVSGSGGIGDFVQEALGAGASFQFSNVVLNGFEVVGNRAIGGESRGKGSDANGGGFGFEGNPSIHLINGLIQENQVRAGDGSVAGGHANGGAIRGDDFTTMNLEKILMVNNTVVGGSGATTGDEGAGDSTGGALTLRKSVATKPNPQVTGVNLIIAGNQLNTGTGTSQWGGGGGFYIEDVDMTLNHVTIDGNTIGRDMQGPAAVVRHNHTSSLLDMHYSIVANHTHAWSQAIIVQAAGDVANINYPLFFKNANGDTGPFPGQNPTITLKNEVPPRDPVYVSPGVPNFNYHLQASSAAIDQAVGSTLEWDIDSDLRILDEVPDVGADEYPDPAFPLKMLYLPTLTR